MPDRLRHHGGFRAAALLLEDDQRLVEPRIALADFFAKDFNLGMLTAEAEYGGSSHVGVMNVACDEAAEIIGVFPSSTAAAFVKQEADTIDVFEQLVAAGRGGIFDLGVSADPVDLPVSI